MSRYDSEEDPMSWMARPKMRSLLHQDADIGDDEEEKEYQSDDESSTADAIKIYLKDIQKSQLLTAAQECELAELIADGDEKARQR